MSTLSLDSAWLTLTLTLCRLWHWFTADQSKTCQLQRKMFFLLHVLSGTITTKELWRESWWRLGLGSALAPWFRVTDRVGLGRRLTYAVITDSWRLGQVYTVISVVASTNAYRIGKFLKTAFKNGFKHLTFTDCKIFQILDLRFRRSSKYPFPSSAHYHFPQDSP